MIVLDRQCKREDELRNHFQVKHLKLQVIQIKLEPPSSKPSIFFIANFSTVSGGTSRNLPVLLTAVASFVPQMNKGCKTKLVSHGTCLV